VSDCHTAVGNEELGSTGNPPCQPGGKSRDEKVAD
jgi:hypothetical protein